MIAASSHSPPDSAEPGPAAKASAVRGEATADVWGDAGVDRGAAFVTASGPSPLTADRGTLLPAALRSAEEALCTAMENVVQRP